MAILCVYSIQLRIAADTEKRKVMDWNGQRNLLPHIEFSTQHNLDCHNNKIPCLTSNDCQRNCSISSLGDISSCINGFCSTNSRSIATEYECDETHGIVEVFIGQEFIVRQSCLSLYRDIFTDNNTVIPFVCDNGSLSINFMIEQFTDSACECAEDTTKFLYIPSKFNRQIPVCIPNHLVNLYKRIYTSV